MEVKPFQDCNIKCNNTKDTLINRIYKIAQSFLVYDKNLENDKDFEIRQYGNLYTTSQKKKRNCITQSSKLSIAETASGDSVEIPKKRKILIVDDTASFRNFLRQLLEKDGHYCEEAQNGRIGLHMVKATTSMNTDDLYLRDYDVVLMNLIMPVMDGSESAIKIQQLGYAGIIIGMSSTYLDEDIECFLKAGASYVLIKPFTMRELNAILDRL